MQNLMDSMQEMEKQQSIAIQNLEKQRTEDEVLRQSIVKHNSAEDEVPKIYFAPFQSKKANTLLEKRPKNRIAQPPKRCTWQES